MCADTSDLYIAINNNERKSEQAHIPQAPTLLDHAAHNKWQCNA